MPSPKYSAQLVDELTAPIIEAYEKATDELLVNIARHFNVEGSGEATRDWQLQKLAESGKLRKESIKIIARNTGQCEALVKVALENAALSAIEEFEPAFRKAVEQGLLKGSTATTAESVSRALKAYQGQALEALNLVNTTMLKSTLAAFRKAVSDIALYEKQILTAQKALNEQTASVITGQASRQEAVRKAIKQMSDKGLTGFTDKAGHNWTPEAYVNMDIRTTCGNVANQAVFARNAAYGNDLISVPIVAGARPGCYPFQGKVYSTTGRSGKVEDLDGNAIHFASLSSTTFGQPAGLFGINCHHSPGSPFIPGYSKLRGEVPDKTESDKIYADSQTQRRLEREVRQAKRDAALADATGDKDAFAEAASKVKQKQTAYNSFIEKTGRTARLDRTQTSTYTRSTASKAQAAQRKAKGGK